MQAFYDGVSSTDRTLNKVEGGYHEMLMGEEKGGMTQGMIDWMRARCGGGSGSSKDGGQRQQQVQQQLVSGGVGEEETSSRVAAAAEGPSGAKL